MKKPAKKKRVSISTILLVLVLLIGLSLLLYPSFSNAWNQRHQSQVIVTYNQDIEKLQKEEYSRIWQSALDFNKTLLSRVNDYVLTEQQKERYQSELNMSGVGIMGYIEIPKIDVYLPIYHGTDEAVLQVGVGHLEWTSLPTGGESTHCVLSGHRGLPSATLFTNLDDLVVGDTFVLTVMNEMLTYEVDQIMVVEPTDTESLLIQEGKDLCTLVTCTPYGINTQRLLVRGHRVENAETASKVKVVSDALEVEPLIVACVIVGPILLLILMVFSIIDRLRGNMK